MYHVLSDEAVGFLRPDLNPELLAQPSPSESSEAQEPTHTHTELLRATALFHPIFFIIHVVVYPKTQTFIVSVLGVYECGPFSKLPPPGVLSENEGDWEVGGRGMELSRVGPLSRLGERQKWGERKRRKLERSYGNKGCGSFGSVLCDFWTYAWLAEELVEEGWLLCDRLALLREESELLSATTALYARGS